MKSTVIETLREYFTSKGRVLTAEEYKEAEDAPIRYQIVKRHAGPWGRLVRMIGEIKPLEVVKPAPVVEKPVVKPTPVKK